MNNLEFAELLNELPDEMLVSAAKRKRPLITAHIWVTAAAAAAAFSLIAGAAFVMSRKGIQPNDQMLTEQSIAAEVTEIAESAQTTGHSGTTATEPAVTESAITESQYAAADTSSTYTTTSSCEETTTNDDARFTAMSALTASQTTGTEPAFDETTTATDEESEHESCQPFGEYTLPESLTDKITASIGTDEYCYYKNEPLPDEKSWQHIYVPIIAKDHTYMLTYQTTNENPCASLNTQIYNCTFTVTASRSLESELSEIQSRFGGMLYSGFSESKQEYQYYLNDYNLTAENGADLQQLRSEWAWKVAHALRTLPDTSVQCGVEYPDYNPIIIQ